MKNNRNIATLYSFADGSGLSVCYPVNCEMDFTEFTDSDGRKGNFDFINRLPVDFYGEDKFAEALSGQAFLLTNAQNIRVTAELLPAPQG